MRKLPVMKFLTGLIALLMIVFSLTPMFVEASAGDEDELIDPSAVPAAAPGDEDELNDPQTQHPSEAGDEDEIADPPATAGDEDESSDTGTVHLQEGSSSLVGIGIALGLIVCALLVLAVVVIKSAATPSMIRLENRRSKRND